MAKLVNEQHLTVKRKLKEPEKICVCSKGHDMVYLKTNPYKGMSVDCDKCNNTDIHP